MACIWIFLGNGMFFFPKNVGFFTYCSKTGKTCFSILCGPRGVDRTPRSCCFDDFLTFKIFKVHFFVYFWPIFEVFKFFYYPVKFILNKILFICNESRVDWYVIVFCAILTRQMTCIWIFLGNGMFFFPKNVGFFTYCSKTGKTCFSILCGPRGVDRTPRSLGFDDFLTFWYFKVNFFV